MSTTPTTAVSSDVGSAEAVTITPYQNTIATMATAAQRGGQLPAA